MWLGMEHDVDRLRPYVSDVENRGTVQLKWMDLGKKVLGKRGFNPGSDESSKRTRHALLMQPTPAQVRFMDVKLGTLRIDQDKTEG
jgi:hypothetical protein